MAGDEIEQEPEQPEQPQLLPYPGLAELHGVHPLTMYQWTRHPEFPEPQYAPRAPGQKGPAPRLYPVDQVQRFVDTTVNRQKGPKRIEDLQAQYPIAESPDAGISAIQIAKTYGVGISAVNNWLNRHPDFPAPVGVWGRQRLYDPEAVKQWIEDRGGISDTAQGYKNHNSPVERMTQPEATLTVTQIAEMTGVSISAVMNWARRFPGFPEPVGEGAFDTARGRPQKYYDANEIRAWLSRNRGHLLPPSGSIVDGM